jgi:hypothetical protein
MIVILEPVSGTTKENLERAEKVHDVSTTFKQAKKKGRQ